MDIYFSPWSFSCYFSCTVSNTRSSALLQLDLGHLPSMQQLLGQHVDLGGVRKIGEGTFGEAFKAGGVVFKIVPMEGQTMVRLAVR